MGRVNFESSVVVNEVDNVEIKIKRTNNKTRIRPDAHSRHNTSNLNDSDTNLNLVDLRDFEWMAWNYRTYKRGAKYGSKENIVAQMFNQTFSFLPTAEEILLGIILA